VRPLTVGTASASPHEAKRPCARNWSCSFFAVPLAVLVAEGALKRFVLIAVILLLIVVELLNTAIEKLADEITTAPRPGIGRIKDMGSAAVGITLVIAGSAWLVAIGQRLSFW
jgi:diacylglycerol kinase (ATP)